MQLYAVNSFGTATIIRFFEKPPAERFVFFRLKEQLVPRDP